MSRKLTSSTKLDNLRKEAKRWLKALRESDPSARKRLLRAHPDAGTPPVLRDVHHALACEYGFKSWKDLLVALAPDHRRAAEDFVQAYGGDASALARLNAYYRRAFSFDDVKAEIWRRVYAFRQRSSRVPQNYLGLDEAQLLVAQDAGFGSWEALVESIETGASSRVAPYAIDSKENQIGLRRRMTDRDWDELIGAMKEHRVTGLDANGLMNDEVLGRIAELGHLTTLRLGGSRELTDDGLLHLARMPQLENLDLSEYPGGKLTDRGLAVLRHLPNLRRFEMTWQSAITDAGVANLRYCDRLVRVNLMGSPTGDGAIEALQGKAGLDHFSTGRLVTDAGIPLLRNFPALQRLVIDGPFSNDGLAGLAALESLIELDLFWHVTGITSEAFAHLLRLPNLQMLGCDGKLSDNAAMEYIAAMPSLRKLRAQESTATDEGWTALSRSKTLESIWGRECGHFGSAGFRALSKMPALRGFGIGCQKVDDAALATLPDFPSLRELTPIGFQDAGFRHVGRCPRLERLTCMYCRDTGDAATEFIAGLGIKYYYAGLTKITDRSLEILGRMSSLEQIEFFECKGITDVGVKSLAGLPNLREVHLGGSQGVTEAGTRVFPEGVRVYYST